MGGSLLTMPVQAAVSTLCSSMVPQLTSAGGAGASRVPGFHCNFAISKSSLDHIFYILSLQSLHRRRAVPLPFHKGGTKGKAARRAACTDKISPVRRDAGRVK